MPAPAAISKWCRGTTMAGKVLCCVSQCRPCSGGKRASIRITLYRPELVGWRCCSDQVKSRLLIGDDTFQCVPHSTAGWRLP